MRGSTAVTFGVVLVALLFIATGGFAAEINVVKSPGAYDYNLKDVTFQDLSAGGSDTYSSTGEEFILFRNTTATDSQVRVVSVDDDFGRSKDLVDTAPANATVVVGPMNRKGWRNSNGNVEIQAEDEISAGDIKVAVFRD